MIMEFLRALVRIPVNFQNKINSIFALHNLRYSVELVSSPYTRIFYNKITVVVNELFTALTYLSPKIYFTNIWTVIFLPFWFIGILQLIKRGNYMIFIKLLIVVFIIYLVGEKEIYYLWPIGLFYIYFIYIGFKSWWVKN